MGEHQCPVCGHIVTGFEQQDFDARVAEHNALHEELVAQRVYLAAANAMVSQKSEQYIAERKACDALRAENARMRESLDAIWQYGSDTLSGPTGDVPNDRIWHRQGVVEMTRRAFAALTRPQDAEGKTDD